MKSNKLSATEILDLGKFMLRLHGKSRTKVSISQLYLLQQLGKVKCMTMTQISRLMGHSTAAATGLVDRLEKLGLAERSHASDDRRKVEVAITPKGREILMDQTKTLQDILDEPDDFMVTLLAA